MNTVAQSAGTFSMLCNEWARMEANSIVHNAKQPTLRNCFQPLLLPGVQMLLLEAVLPAAVADRAALAEVSSQGKFCSIMKKGPLTTAPSRFWRDIE